MRSHILSAAFAAVLLTACGPSEEQISANVKPLLNEQFQKPEYKNFGLTVESVEVIHENGNRYRGMAKVGMDGKVHDVPISITSDGKRLMYEISPDALAFVAQEAMRKAIADTQQKIAEIESNEMPVDVQAWTAQVDYLNDLCRGRPGDDPEGMKACTERDRISTEIRKKDWCWGHKDDFGYQRKWVRCAPGD